MFICYAKIAMFLFVKLSVRISTKNDYSYTKVSNPIKEINKIYLKSI